MKTEAYSWRLSERVKMDLEREARARKMPVSSILDMAVRDWLKKAGDSSEYEEGQWRLHAVAAQCLGVLTGGNPRRAEMAREAIRARLRRRRVR